MYGAYLTYFISQTEIQLDKLKRKRKYSTKEYLQLSQVYDCLIKLNSIYKENTIDKNRKLDEFGLVVN